jgi:hypothetical protein
MGRRASQEMGQMGACFFGGLAMQNGEEFGCTKHEVVCAA